MVRSLSVTLATLALVNVGSAYGQGAQPSPVTPKAADAGVTPNGVIGEVTQRNCTASVRLICTLKPVGSMIEPVWLAPWLPVSSVHDQYLTGHG